MATDSERIDALEQRLNRIEQILGDWTTPPLLAQGQTPIALPNDRYDLKESDWQLHHAIDELKQSVLPAIRQDITDLKAQQPVSSGSSSVIPVTAPAGAVAVRETMPLVSRVYREGDYELAAEVHDAPQQFNAPVGFGGSPLQGIPVAVRVNGQIVFALNVKEADTQEKNGDRLRLGAVLFEGHDGGVRLVQGGAWIGGQLNRVQDEVRILAMDSKGTVSKSVEDFSKPRGERGQLWIIREDFEKKKICVTPCRAGWGVELEGSTQTMNDHNPNPNDRSVTAIEPIMQSTDIRVEDWHG